MALGRVIQLWEEGAAGRIACPGARRWLARQMVRAMVSDWFFRLDMLQYIDFKVFSRTFVLL